jgi:cytochrome P450
MDGCRRRYGPTFTLRFVGGRDLVFVSAPDDVKAVFTDAETFQAANPNFRRFLGQHTLLALEGDAHRRHRRLLMPPFHGARMRAYGPLLVALTERHLARWPRERPFRLLEALRRITLEAIFKALFGITDEARAARLDELMGQLAGRWSALLSFIPALHVDLGPWSPWGRFLRARAEFDRILQAEIVTARAAVAAGAPREDVLAKVIEESARHGDPLGDDELRDELLTLLITGHETTATGLAWAFQYVLGHPAALARLVTEVRGVAGDELDLERLPYLDAVVQETLRLSPPLPVALLRRVTREVRLGGFDLPPGCHAVPCMHLAHRREDAFPEPGAFRPERHLERRRSAFELFPFGGGLRTCMGLAFGLYEMKVILATVLRSAELRLAGPFSTRTARQSVVIVPADGTRVVVAARALAGATA